MRNIWFFKNLRCPASGRIGVKDSAVPGLRILVYPHDLTIGGSQINAIDLAAGVAQAGHEVVVYGIPGPLVAYIEERGVRFIPARKLKYRPAPSRIAQLTSIAVREKLDLIHAYEWPPCLDAYYGAGLFARVPVLCTVLGMTVMPMVPRSVPLIMGTAELGVQARELQSGPVWVIEPPIDTDRDNLAIDGSALRRASGVSDSDLLIVTVSRLSLDLKIDALVRAIDAVELLAHRHPIKLVLVGDGQARTALANRAKAVNARCGREVVRLHGEELDPRPAYAAADLVLGMGSSSLRAMAMGRPVIVQGEHAFSEIFEPATHDLFLNQGFYGIADAAFGVERLAGQMDRLLRDPELRRQVGMFGHKVVTSRFSLKRAVQVQLEIYDEMLRRPLRRSMADALRAAAGAVAIEIGNHDPRRKRQRKAWAENTLLAAQAGVWPPTDTL